MLFLTLCTPTARSFLRNGPSQISGFHNKFWFCTTSPVFTMDDSVPSSGVSTPVSGVATPLRGKVNNNNNNGKGKGGGGKPVVKKKEVRILMLHGFTQSGPLFRAKTRALEKLMAKTLAPLNLVPTLVYPTAPNRLRSSDVPGYAPSDDEAGGEGEIDSWAWFKKDEANGTYRFLKEGMERLAESITEAVAVKGVDGEQGAGEEEGEVVRQEEDAVIDGVIGFSQGGCMAALLASAMETSEGRNKSLESADAEQQEWVRQVREANKGRPLKFAVIYSGFFAPPGELAWLYEPKVQTPTLHFIGSLDTVVEESRCQGLIDRCEGGLVVIHPGGHYVPVNKEWVMPLVGFIRNCLAGGK